VQFDVAVEDAGKRLDRFLAEKIPDTSRARVQEWIRAGRAQVNGASARSSLRLDAGDRVEVEPAPARPLRAFAEDIPLAILYEDDDLAAINKPAGMTVHAGAGVAEGTLVNALLHHFGSLSGVGGELRPGIVHRLDRHTSGVLLVAKNDRAHRVLARQFESRKVQKTYWAIVEGRVSEADLTAGRLGGRGIHPLRVEADGQWWVRLEMPIRRDPRHRTKMTARTPRTFVGHPADRFEDEEREEPVGRPARTDFRIVKAWEHFTLLEVRIATGRTHQIRVHLSAVGHPVAGDRLYGAAATPVEWRVREEDLPSGEEIPERGSGAGDTGFGAAGTETNAGGGGGGQGAVFGLQGLPRRPEPCASPARPEPCATGRPAPGGPLSGAEPGAKRFYLHARRIRLAHPSTHAPLSIEAPLPPDFEKVLRLLGV
jgi:23S rRNA pseudouridine1911/1915/1917 synthase